MIKWSEQDSCIDPLTVRGRTTWVYVGREGKIATGERENMI